MPLIEDMRQYGREWLGVDDDSCRMDDDAAAEGPRPRRWRSGSLKDTAPAQRKLAHAQSEAARRAP